MGMIGDMRQARNDARTFGVPFLGRRFARPDPHGVVTVNTRLGQLHFRLNDTDIDVLRQIFVDGEYDFDDRGQMETLRRRYREILAAGDTPVVVDAGANIGAASIWFARRFPQAAIAAVEPDAENVRLARLNTAAFDNTRVFEAAIGSRAGGVKLIKTPGHGWAVRTERSDSGAPVMTVPELVATVDRGRLFIVKVDIEGFEADLFSENIDWVDDAAAIIVEPHDWMLPGAGTSQAFQKALMGKGREMLIVGENLIFV
jgi:FkbM family methyltransferase